MKKLISTLGKVLNKEEQNNVFGGFNNIAECYDYCIRNSADRMELGECFDQCQIIF
ncbi:conserved protein of unknown function [Tenacibaculum sp. 190524A02b]|uniref:Uncharacterized protein n=1 Tax=Tenacibaculum vairaonense TaxID=3137860 RepID=A0ABM9PK33_9FLAO